MRLMAVVLIAIGVWALAIVAVQGAIGEDDDAQSGRVGRAPLFLLTSRFDVEAYIRSAPREPHTIAILWDVPRRRRGNLRRVLRRTRVAQVQIVLLNETCARNRVCEPRDALYGFTEHRLARSVKRSGSGIKTIVQREAVAALSQLGPVIGSRAVMMNPLLETRLTPDDWDRAAGWVQEVIGEVPLVWNPLNNSHAPRPSRATYTEHHGLSATCDRDGRTIANLDGSGASSEQMREWLRKTRHCRLSLLWESADNCRSPKETTFIPPTQRFCGGNFNAIRSALR